VCLPAQGARFLEEKGCSRPLARGSLAPQTTSHTRKRPPAPPPPTQGSVGITIGCMQPLLSAGVFQLGMLYGGPAEVVRLPTTPLPLLHAPDTHATHTTQVYGFLFVLLFGL
jgi:hypothetical protein